MQKLHASLGHMACNLHTYSWNFYGVVKEDNQPYLSGFVYLIKMESNTQIPSLLMQKYNSLSYVVKCQQSKGRVSPVIEQSLDF